MRNLARLVVVLCAAASMACTLYAGQRNRSVLLVGLFAVWVVAPFAGLLGVLRRVECGADGRTRRAAGHGDGQSATVVQAIGAIVSLATLLLYAAFALHPPARNAAAPFLMIPLCSWAVVACMLLYDRSKRTRGL